MVPILFHCAARTDIRPAGQRHLLPMAAGGTGLGRIGRIDLPEYMVRAECQEALISFKSLWFNNSHGFESQFSNRTHVDFSPGAGFRLPVLEIGINLLSEYPF